MLVFTAYAERAFFTDLPAFETSSECGGSIWQIGTEEPLRFRCHIGHSFTADIFLSEQTQNVDNALWSAVRAMEEKVTFSRQMAERMKNYNLQQAATKYEDHAQSLDEEVSLIRQIILNGFVTNRTIAEDYTEPQEQKLREQINYFI